MKQEQKKSDDVKDTGGVMRLSYKQSLAMEALEDPLISQLLYGGAAGGGKSFLGCYWVIKNCLKYKETRWVIARHQIEKLKKTTLRSFFAVCKMMKLESEVHYRYNVNAKSITWYNGSEIFLYDLAHQPSDPDYNFLGSLEITGAFVDECNEITAKAWEVLSTRIRYKLKEYGLKPKLLGTCNPSKNWVYTDFYAKERKGTIEDYKKFIPALVTDNGDIPEEYVVQLSRVTDIPTRERLLNGNWDYDSDPSELMSRQDIDTMFTDSDKKRKGLKYMTIDVARKGKDSTVICLWNGLWCYRVIVLKKKGINELLEEVEKLRLSHSIGLRNIIADEDGVGGGLVDMLGCVGFINNAKPLPSSITKSRAGVNYFNLKSQCYWELANFVKEGKIYVNIDPSNREILIEELAWVKRENMDKEGKLKVIGKDVVKAAIGRSPDFSDAIMMRMFFELKKQVAFVAA